jgi:hypothetical protein
MRFLAEEVSVDTYVNVMDQYRPCYKAFRYPPLTRRITPEEFAEAIRQANPHNSRTLMVRELCADRGGRSAPVGFDRPYGPLKVSPERSPAPAGRSRSPQGGLFTLRE